MRVWPKPNILITIISLFLLSVIPLKAQLAGNIDIEFTETGKINNQTDNQTNNQALTVGDIIQLTLTVTYPANYELIIPSLSQNWEDFEIKEQFEPETIINDNSTKTSTQIIQVSLFEVGTFQTPTWTITLRDQDDTLLERAVPQVSLTILSVLPAGETELQDLKPQVDLDVPPLWPWVLLAMLITVFVVGGLWWGYNRFIKKQAVLEPELIPQPIIDPRPAHQIAYEELDRIEQLDLLGQGRFKEYYTLVSDCMRYYLEGRYQIPALDLTTAEIKANLNSSTILTTHAQQFLTLFSISDLVKFARLTPDLEEAINLITQARQLIDNTKSTPIPLNPVLDAEIIRERVA